MTALGVAISSGHMKTCQFLSKHLNTGFDDEIENQSNEVENQSNLEIIQSHLQELDEHFINMEDNQSLVTDKQVDGTRKSPRKSEITITYIKNSPKSPKERGLSSPKTRKLAVNAKLSRLSVRNRKLSGNTELSPSSARTRKLSGNTELSPSSARQRKISGNAELFPGKADSTSVQAERSPKSPKESGITSPSRRKSTKDAEISNVDKNSDTIKSPRKGIKRKFEDYKAGEEGMSENEKAGDDSDDEGFTNVFEFSKNLNKMFQIKYFNKKFKTDRDTNNNNDKVKQNTTDKKRSPVDNKSERKVVSEESSTEIVMPVTCCRQSYSLEKMEMLSMNEKSIENVEKIRRLTRRNPYSSNLRQSWSVYKSKRQSVTRRHSVGSISMKQKVDSESCPRLSPHVSDQITKLKEGMEECPPMLSSEASLNILEEAKSLAEKEQKLKATEVCSILLKLVL